MLSVPVSSQRLRVGRRRSRISCDRRVFQNLPDRLLPPALRSDNPSDAARRIDGALVLT